MKLAKFELSDMRNLLFIIIVVTTVLNFDGCCHGQVEGDGISPMLREEQEALYTAIQGFVGNWWNGSDLYPDPCGWTPIQGVACDLFDRIWYVTNINIGPVHDNSLTCTQNPEFRPQLFHLSHLKTLSFFSCFTSQHHHPMILPTHSWERLSSSLQSLEFRSNPALDGPIPTTFGSLKALQSLVLQNNGLTGPIPSNIGNLANLKRLVISGNRVASQVPHTLGNLDQLLIMDFSTNLLSGTLPSTFGGLSSLLKLDLSNNFIVGPIPIEITNLKNLTLLDLRNNNFSRGSTLPFQKLECLEELALAHNPIGGDLHLIDWPSMKNLVFLDLSSCGLTGEIPESITEMKNLRYLVLSNNKLTGNLSPKLESMSSLSSLYVQGNNLSGELRFSYEWYLKMGRRFGAWSNPELCYAGHGEGPLGMRPCQGSDLTFHETEFESENQKKMVVDEDMNQVQGLMKIGTKSKV